MRRLGMRNASGGCSDRAKGSDGIDGWPREMQGCKLNNGRDKSL